MNQFEKFPLNNEKSTFVMGNIIAFNPKTGLYEANPAGWMGLGMPNVVACNNIWGCKTFYIICGCVNRIVASLSSRLKPNKIYKPSQLRWFFVCT